MGGKKLNFSTATFSLSLLIDKAQLFNEAVQVDFDSQLQILQKRQSAFAVLSFDFPCFLSSLKGIYADSEPR